MTYKKGSYLAVKSEEGGFYLCKALENIPHNSVKEKKYRIKWLEQVYENTYKISYDDTIFPESIIDIVVLVNRKSSLKLADSEITRIEGLAKCNEHLTVEESWSDADEDHYKPQSECIYHTNTNSGFHTASLGKNNEGNHAQDDGNDDRRQINDVELEPQIEDNYSKKIDPKFLPETKDEGKDRRPINDVNLKPQIENNYSKKTDSNFLLETKDEGKDRRQIDGVDLEPQIEDNYSKKTNSNFLPESKDEGKDRRPIYGVDLEPQIEDNYSKKTVPNFLPDTKDEGKDRRLLNDVDLERQIEDNYSKKTDSNFLLETKDEGKDRRQIDGVDLEPQIENNYSKKTDSNFLLKTKDEGKERRQIDGVDLEPQIEDNYSMKTDSNFLLETKDEGKDRRQIDDVDLEPQIEDNYSKKTDSNFLPEIEYQEKDRREIYDVDLETQSEDNYSDETDSDFLLETEDDSSDSKSTQSDDESGRGNRSESKTKRTIGIFKDKPLILNKGSLNSPLSQANKFTRGKKAYGLLETEDESSDSKSTLSDDVSGRGNRSESKTKKSAATKVKKIKKRTTGILKDKPLILNKGSINSPLSQASKFTLGEKAYSLLETEDESSDSKSTQSEDDSGSRNESESEETNNNPSKNIIKNKKIKKRTTSLLKEREPILRNGSVNIPLSQANKLIGKNKVYDQVHSCFFCDKLISKMSRHLERCHAEEMDVAKILAMPKNSKLRRDAFIELTRIGDYHYNCDVLALKSGELILLRRPSAIERESKTYQDYLPCPHCLGFLLKKHLWSHIKYNCQIAKTDKSNSVDRKKTDHLGLSKALIGHTLSSEMSASFYQNIIANLKKKDGVKEICTEDPLIVRLGMLLFEKFNLSKNDTIRQNMRRLGRLVLEFRKVDCKFSQATLLECLLPQNFDYLIQVVKSLTITELNSVDRPKMKIPSLALKIGHALRKCASLQRGTYLKEGKLKNERMMKSFLSLMDLEWENRISSTALNTFRKAKLTKQDLLPLTSDLQKLNTYLDKSIESYIMSLKENPRNEKIWLSLSKSTLSRIMIFNKKRSGEIAKMKTTDYTERRDWEGENSEEIKSTLTDLEKRLMESMTLIYIVGKRERNVPILLTNGMKKAIDVLLMYRKNVAMVNSENEYMFPKLNSNLHLRGHDVLRQICSEVSLEKPDLINSTKMRKYIATVTQVLDLTENESDWLARHLGHNIRVHREFYRLQESAVELTKVSRLLLAVDSGKISEFSGQKLDDVNVEDLPLLGLSDSENEDECTEQTETEQMEEENEQKLQTSIKKSYKRKTLGEEEWSKRILKEIPIRKKIVKNTRKLWPKPEKAVLLDHFKPYIKRGEVPGKVPCEEFLAKNETNSFFSSLLWKDIKYGVYNHIQRVKQTRSKF